MSTITRAPLTYAQQLVLRLERAVPGSVLGPRFLVRAAYTVRHGIDQVALRAAVDDVVARHDALRTVIAGGLDDPHLRVLPPMPGRLITQDVTDVDAFLAEVSDADYPVDEPPLLWVRLGRCADGSSVLVIVAHHLAADAWSLPLLARDLVDAYTARVRGGEPLGADVMQYAAVAEDDFSPGWQATIEQALPYWRERLAGTAGLSIEVPTPAPAGSQVTRRFRVPAELRPRLVTAARRAKTTPATLLFTAFVAAMFPDRADVVVPVVTAGRQPSEWHTVGMMVNVLWMRVTRDDPSDLRETLRRVDRACREAYGRDIPLLRVLREAPELASVAFRPAEIIERTFPAFQVIPASPITPNSPDPELVLEAIAEDRQPGLPAPASLAWSMRLDDVINGYVTYDGNLFGPEWIDERVEGYLRVLAELADGGVAA
jgi:condensation enzyme